MNDSSKRDRLESVVSNSQRKTRKWRVQKLVEPELESCRRKTKRFFQLHEKPFENPRSKKIVEPSWKSVNADIRSETVMYSQVLLR